jgi:uncharacterized protein
LSVPNGMSGTPLSGRSADAGSDRAPGAHARHVFYLHGFASSPRSQKAAYFDERLRAHGVTLHCPDFNEPDFATLTLTRMLDQLGSAIEALDERPVDIIGSSLGAVVAIHLAERMPDRIRRLVLLAPALGFMRTGQAFLGDERLALWRSRGAIDVFHFGYGERRLLNYSFYEDSLNYDAVAADVRQPVFIAQGLLDEAVDYRVVRDYAATRSNVTLLLLDDGHQLVPSLPTIWERIALFLELTA